jgi:hypothetical protein
VQTDNDIYAGALADLTKPVRCDSTGSLPNGNIPDHELNQLPLPVQKVDRFENNVRGKGATWCGPSLALARLLEPPIKRVW